MTVATTVLSSESSSSNVSNELNIPHEFLCPVTQEVMKNPLMSRYGQTYEADAIFTCISKHNNLCPLTRQVLTVSDLIRHRSLQARIETWKLQNGMNESSSSACDDGIPSILLTCRVSDLLSSSDHNPKKQTQEPEEEINQQQQRQQRRLGQRILRMIRSSC